MTNVKVVKLNLSIKNIQKVVKGSKLINLVDCEVCVYISSLVILRRGTRNANESKAELGNLEIATKGGINKLKAIAQHLSVRRLSFETNLAHSKEGPVVEVIEKVKLTYNKISISFQTHLMCLNVTNVNPSIQIKNYRSIWTL